MVSLNFEIPKKVWSGKNPSYSNRRVFDCLAFVYVSKELRLKPSTRTTLYIFIGYEDTEFEYRLWDPKTNMVIGSKDVLFHENQTLEDTEKLTISPNPKFSAQDIAPDPAPI